MKKATVLFSICEKFKSRAVKAAGKGIFYKFNFFLAQNLKNILTFKRRFRH